MAGRLDSLLLLLPSVALGGAEAHSFTLARHLAREGVALHLAAEPWLLGPAAARLGVAARLHPGRFAWHGDQPPAVNLLHQAAATAALLEEISPAMALLPLPWPIHGLGIQRGLAVAGQPGLVVAHLAPPDGARGAILTAGGVVGGRLRYAAVSAPLARRIAPAFGLAPEDVAVVPNGVPVPPEDPAARATARAALRHRLGLPPGAPLVVFAGRLERVKGADLLPAIAAGIATACGATLAALGEGSLALELAEQEAAALDGPLRLPGQVGEVAAWLLAADALLLPSRMEGCPLVFLEAAARRCPVVATEAALECLGEAAPQLATLVPRADAAALTEALAASLSGAETIRRRTEAAHRHALAHDEDAMLRCYAGLLRAALA